MTLTILAEDNVNPDHPELKSDHGFSLLADTGEIRLLYDFGAEGTLLANSRMLDVDLGTVDTAVLSHGHYDHADGMEDFLSVNTKATIHHGRGAFHPRWSISKGSPRDVGISLIPTEKIVSRLAVIDSLTDSRSYTVLPAASGHRGRPAGNASLLSGPEGNRLQDDFTDELTLVLRNSKGLVVVSGCSHRGILNIIDQVKAYCSDCPIQALIGGFHLIDKDENEESLIAIGKRLKKDLPDTRIITGHCTGKKAAATLEETMGRSIERMHAGMVLSF